MAKPKQQQKQELKRVNIHIDPELHKAFKTAAVAQGKKMTDLLLDFIESYIEKYLPSGLKKGHK